MLTSAVGYLCLLSLAVVSLCFSIASAQSGHPTPSPPPHGVKPVKCSGRPVPQLDDITAKAGIAFRHTSDPSKKYIVESMSGGVVLIHYDRDGWPDIFFTNAPTVEMATKGVTSPGALYHNNHDGTFTDATAKAGLNSACFGMAALWATITTTAGPTSTKPASAETFYIATMEMALSPMSLQRLAFRMAAGQRALPLATTTTTASST